MRRALILDAGSAEPLYSGTLDCAIKIVRNGGITSLWSGALANTIRAEATALMVIGFDTLLDNKH